MYSDSEEETFSLEIQPYQYEPLRKAGEFENYSSEEEEEDDVEAEGREEREGNLTLYAFECKCSHCTATTAVESVCCYETEEMVEKMGEQVVGCITQHTGFKNNCLDHDVLEVSFWHYVKQEGPFDDDHPVNQLYRHVAYRRFTTWI
ncbi:uncharacterized protein [Antedon mediterranea]|uniref:uncharacterized protein n=1 Tax=Antedon mediterranea TaxID=105859 RepID=UPI003AF450B9